MQDMKVTKPADEKTGTEVKLAYTKPALRVFGSVSVLTMGGGATLSDGINTTMMSDRRVKENIVRMGINSLGLGLYLYDYKPEYQNAMGIGKQFGVMADEVEAIMPEAVSIHADGYKMVDYRLVHAALVSNTQH